MINNYIRQQLEFLNPSKLKPTLASIKDNKSHLTATFSVADLKDPIILTLDDLALIRYSNTLNTKLNDTRTNFIKAVCCEIKSSIVSRRRKTLDFTFPISPETEDKVDVMVDNIINSDLFPANLNLEYINSLSVPLINYNITKILVERLQKLNKAIPQELTIALQNPNEYFNPVEIDKQSNDDAVLENIGDEVNFDETE
jgi:hypothetical protein